MKYQWGLLLLLIGLNCLKAQDEVSKTLSGKYNVYPADSMGVVLLNRNLKQMSNGDYALSFLGLNDQLEKKWENVYPFSRGYSPVFQEITAQGIVILFADPKGKSYELIKANSDFGDYERFKYEFSKPVVIEEITYYYDNVWAAGSIDGFPAIFKLKPDNTFETIPVGAPGLVKYAGQINYNKNTKGFDFLLLIESNREDAIIWRSMALDGSVLQNQMLRGFEKDRIKSVKAVYTSNSAYVAGTYSIGTRDKLAGVFFAEINEVNHQLKKVNTKSLSGLGNYKKLENIEEKGFNSAAMAKLKSTNKSFFIDDLQIDRQGVLSVAVEVFKPEYRNRSAFEKQIIARDRVDQIDQNVFGRQTGLGAGVARDLEGRMERASATDQLQYRFMDQSLGKAVNEGISYSHTAIVMLDERMNIVKDYGVNFDLRDRGTVASSTHFKQGVLCYASEGGLKQFNTQSQIATIVKSTNDVQMVYWTNNQYLEAEVDIPNKFLKLSGRRFD
ncbi:hypothetical protein [Roseivirga misakiensis]|uniref:WG repeat-containing protein n=1 Tax=Roseivirga misakiensis TaxID=1563681 RepID=A0A1E5T0A0_9BACT|nr:hypothetical protein [Roseivirga misakiensis]OEK04800.1 hypothetical protein BFP71_15255 [Roseivirga misakiensis]